MTSELNIGTLASALVPVLFVLVLGYWAGKHHSFDQEQASGFSTLALSFALPAALFVGMAQLKREQLLQQGPLLLALLLSYGAMYAGVYLLARRQKSLGDAGAAIVALLVSFPAAPVYGLAVLKPLFGANSTITVGLISLICNLTLTPVTLVLLARSSPPKASPPKTSQPKTAAEKPEDKPKKKTNVLLQSLESPLVWAPLAGVLLVLVGVHVPALVNQTLDLLGVSSSGVAIFASGLVLAAHKITLSREVWLVSFAKMIAAPALLLALLVLFHVHGTLAGAALVGTALPTAVISVLLAARHGVAQALAATVLFITSAATIVMLPLSLWASHVLK